MPTSFPNIKALQTRLDRQRWAVRGLLGLSSLLGLILVLLPLKKGIEEWRAKRPPIQATLLQNIIQNPSFSSHDDHNQPFVIESLRAIQISADTIELQSPKLTLTLENGNHVTLSATKGFYERDQHQVHLKENVRIVHDDGYDVQTSVLLIDLKTSQATGPEPVVGTGPQGNIRAKTFAVVDRGARLVFNDRPHLTLKGGKE